MSFFAQAADITIRVGNVFPADHSIPVATGKFKELVEQKTGKKVEVQVFNNSELGSEREMAEMVRNGSLEIVLSGLPGTGAYVPEIEVMEAFYLYNSIDDLARLFKAVTPDLQAFLEPKGFHLIGGMYQGPRNTISTKPLTRLADFKGLRLRVPQTPLFVGLARAWGATPTAIALTEVYTSFETGVIEAAEAVAETMATSAWQEKAKYMLLTKHNFYPQPIVANKKWFDGLPTDVQKALEESADEAARYQLTLAKESEQKAMDKIRSAGVKVTELGPTDMAEFKKAGIEMSRAYFGAKSEKVKELYEKLLKLGGNS
jgi:tripartite ATP-independent transporter DctP family solute receptor